MVRNLLKSLARPEGLEPPTYRFEDASDTHSHKARGKRSPTFLDFRGSPSLWFPTLPGESGHIVVTKTRTRKALTYRLLNFKPLKSLPRTGTFRGM